MENTFSAIWHALGRIEPAAVLLSVVALVLLFGLGAARRSRGSDSFRRRWPWFS